MPRSILTFTADDQAKADEGEFNPNGTFVHQVDAADASLAALPGCGPEPSTIPRARYALTAAYRDPATNGIGNLIQLSFPDPQRAAAWLSVFQADLKHCPRAGMTPALAERSVQDRRESGGITWSEAGVLTNDRVTLAALQGTHDTGRILATLQRLPPS
ncbi:MULTISPECIES: hypothetical protein [Aestuariimicrobium]|uniref:hypothetical protein n=1 Tax=Aestuariimicrobium TaxID=396388 RepID=UPI0003B50094|nr:MULTISPECIES: hypothetical protein [Aestuariimicrobium]